MSAGTKGPDSYDELARRHRGEQPAAARVAQRRSGAAEAPGRAAETGRVTDVSPEDITAGAIALGKARAGLRVPGVGGDALRDLSARIDEHVGYVTPILGGLVEVFPKVGATAQATTHTLEEGLRQRTEMLELRGTATQLRTDVTDTRRGTSDALRRDMKALAAEIREQLRPGRLPKAAQDRLRSDAGEFLELWERVEKEPVIERQKTQLQGRAHDEALAEEEQKTELLRTMLALQSGEVVDQAEWDRAAASYDELAASTELASAPNRRGRSR